ncbi:MAG TPA: Uma2 family endonuclease [Pyrinomonadaceae bacterium]|nr:Uma2 family endonuclease [Pyrinomonadaceae bacterium]
MGLPKFRTKISVEDYLESEKFSPIRHEFVEGEVFAMAGASDNHGRISTNLITLLATHLRNSPCDTFANDIKVRVRPNVYYYPDILVSCEETPEDPYFRNNPTLIIEIISKSTARVDRTEKVFLYQQIPSLQEYVVVDQYRMEVQVHRRQENGGWITYFFNELDDIVEFTSVDLTIPLPEIYRRVTFEPNADRDEY